VAILIHARFAHPDAGWPAEREAAREVFTDGELLTIQDLHVGRSQTTVTFYEHPGAWNHVHFDSVSDEELLEDENPG
jgi:hypothetical protein